jgi:hypothetical protein
MAPLLLGGIFEERPHARKLARGRRWTEPLPAPLREKCAEVGRRKAEKAGRADRLPPILTEKLNQPMRGRHISANRMRGTPAVVLKMAGPASGKLARRVGDQV